MRNTPDACGIGGEVCREERFCAKELSVRAASQLGSQSFCSALSKAAHGAQYGKLLRRRERCEFRPTLRAEWRMERRHQPLDFSLYSYLLGRDAVFYHIQYS